MSAAALIKAQHRTWLGPWRRVSFSGSARYECFERLCTGPRDDVVYFVTVGFSPISTPARITETPIDDIIEYQAYGPTARTYEQVRDRPCWDELGKLITHTTPEKKRWRR